MTPELSAIAQPMLATLAQPLLAFTGLVITTAITLYVPKALAAFERRTGIVLTDQQRAVALGAVKTAAGIVETKLDQGILTLAHVNPSNPAMIAEAQQVLIAVPGATAALNMSADGIARMIVGAVDTSAHGAPAPK